MTAGSLRAVTLASIIVLAGCATTDQPPVAAVESRQGLCQTNGVVLDIDFPAGNVGSCQVTGSNAFTLTITPEDAPPINCSAWYAFRLTPRAGNEAQKVSISLDYEACGHRYWPKTSSDGNIWTRLSNKQLELNYKLGSSEGTRLAPRATFKVDLEPGTPLFVAAQEILVPATYDAWIERVSAADEVTAFELGKSAEGRDIPALSIVALGQEPKEQVVLVGRQHPPEITGALAMFPFVETLLADTPLARKYRARFATTVVPMLNPDGVVRGYWRHNTGSTDLNRDWGPFKQPETRLMDRLLKDMAADPDRELSFFADFHSTQRDIFYTIPDEFPTRPKLFIKRWLGLLETRMPDFEVRRSVNKNLSQANSKNYVYRTYGVPTVTYEMGDETDRELIRKVAQEAAVAMMETLLAPEPE
ncbi:Zinc carboxypeptidase [Parasphingorhabdus marina DSM 22363]|uniref:Zinc carboxypeptidase n=1 Tax=Parasphingorhabdus marina DSM 22363 TaxID=1123272 RepID=A0A1N6DAF9_9SPHN|nr:M14-type cytosolic carboxypeptidase [Parasphingorhabdus marina]SIN67801.1 Zinc carboxypeptidase [Parasphingorhabdus marina DSM 22363]